MGIVLIMPLSIFFAICIPFVIWKNVDSQTLYKEKSHWHTNFNRDSKELFLKSSVEDIAESLKEVKVQLKECKSTQLSVFDSYKELLIMSNKGRIPNGMYLILYSLDLFLYCHIMLALSSIVFSFAFQLLEKKNSLVVHQRVID